MTPQDSYTELSLTDLEPVLRDLRAEDSLLFSAERALSACDRPTAAATVDSGSSGVLALTSLAADYFGSRPRELLPAIDLFQVAGVGGAIPTPLQLPVRTPASDRPVLRHLLPVGMILLGVLGITAAFVLAARSTAKAPAQSRSIEPTHAIAPEPALTPMPALTPATAAATEPATVTATEPATVTATATEPATEPATATVTKPRPKRVRKPAPKPAPKPATEPDYAALLDGSAPSSDALLVAAAPAPLPDKLDSFMISDTMKDAERRAAGCDDRFGSGRVTLRLSVAPAGKVTDVRVLSATTPELGACAADAARKTTFPATHTGATFAYLFPF